MNDLVSIIVPIYNTSKYLRTCVDSLRNQTYANIEIVLVNDGSTDESSLICDEYVDCDRRIIAVSKPNGGLVSAWKMGISVSSGRYVAFVDSDDWISEYMIEDMANHIIGNEREMILANYIIEKRKSSKGVIQAIRAGEYNRDRIEREVIPNILGHEQRRIAYSRCTKLFSKKLLEDNIKYTNEFISLGEDMNIVIPSILDCDRMYVMEEGLLYHYRYVDESMVHKYVPDMLGKIVLLRDTIDNILIDKQRIKLRNMLDQEYIFLLLYVIKNELRGEARGCNTRIADIIRSNDNMRIIADTDIEVRSLSNKLLYSVIRYPNVFKTVIAWLIIRLYDICNP